MKIELLIESIQKTIKAECHREDDYAAYVENCLLYEVHAAAEHYGCTVDQFKYCCKRALLSI